MSTDRPHRQRKTMSPNRRTHLLGPPVFAHSELDTVGKAHP